ncbi:MAG: hypothetical protein WD042_08230 [Phycisphaeraceae bacterium]
MKTKRFILVVFLWLLGPLSLAAGVITAPDAPPTKLEGLVKPDWTLTDLATTIDKQRVKSLTLAASRSDTAPLRNEMVKRMVSLLADSRVKTLAARKERRGQLASVYAAISQGGHYDDLFVADLIRRELVRDAHQTLLEDKDEIEYGQYVDLLSAMTIMKMNAKVLAAKPSAKVSEAADLVDWVSAVLETQDMTESEFSRLPQMRATDPRTVGENRKPMLLLNMLLDTEFITTVHLPGMRQFLKRGGKLDDLYPHDVRKFLEIMPSEVRREFRFALRGVRSLSPVHLQIVARRTPDPLPLGLLPNIDAMMKPGGTDKESGAK